ncbi:protein kinase [Arthrobacter sp. JZ12]|uniref:serine/threonine-protein kinase n=1 Tax=Arthrobacter sp. JZ12 TaxID=2654190 RepID=UPI002B45E54D|nr:protein kinase [Arthrobacter sp. JZ12]WRH24286.1 protein kinase [Arthrobacter sp. JZ12]
MQLPPPPGRSPEVTSEPGRTGSSPGVRQDELLGGRYSLGNLLGTGGMAEVRRGHDQVLGRDIAIKLFRGQPETRLTSRERSEAQLLASLDHPGVVKVHDVGHAPHAGWVVMDLIDGSDLHRLLHGGALDLQRTWNVAHDVSRTLAYVHAKGITHRDVKPSNILAREADPSSGLFAYVLTDFGIAQMAGSDRLTATGETIGTAAYFSPEQARGGAVSPATDIYALGLVILECLTGEPAFEGRGLETALARLHRAPEIPASVTPAWRDLITRMTALDAGNRPSAAQVATILVEERAAFLAASAGPATAVLPGPVPGHAPPSSPAEAHRPAFVLGLNDDDASAGQPSPTAQATKVHTATKTGPKPQARKQAARKSQHRRWWAAVAVVLVLIVAAAIVMLSGMLSPVSEPEPLPSVPGVPGERLSELYESVQP